MRIFDFLASLLLLIFFSPIILLIALLVLLFLGRPVFFKQVRPGYKAKPFILYKFRSMKNYIDSTGLLLSDKYRLTKFGKFLRSTSLDELPQLYNVLTGQMSFVGPRPLLVEYLNIYNDFQMQRHNVKPGITGLAQVLGRNNLSWRKKLFLDVWYTKRQNIFLNFWILKKTFINVLLRKNINSVDNATTEKFNGMN